MTENRTANNARAAGTVMTVAEAHELPMPSIVTLYDFKDGLCVHFDSLTDLTAWAVWADEPVAQRGGGDDSAIHHVFTGEILDCPIDACYIDHAVHLSAVPISTQHYSCSKCGVAFGIAGTSTGSQDDLDADDYFEAEVQRHESGECVAMAVRS